MTANTAANADLETIERSEEELNAELYDLDLDISELFDDKDLIDFTDEDVLPINDADADEYRLPELTTPRSKANYIAKYIIRYAANRAPDLSEGERSPCGRVIAGLEKRTGQKVRVSFSEDEMGFIIRHLPPINTGDTIFHLDTPDEPLLCDKLNRQLNGLIPKWPKRGSLKGFLDC